MKRTEEQLAAANAAARAVTAEALEWWTENAASLMPDMTREARVGLMRLAELGREYLDILLREEEEDDA